MKDNTILRKSLAFSVRIVNLHKYLTSQKKEATSKNSFLMIWTRDFDPN